MKTKLKNKQPFRPFAPVANQIHNAAIKQKKERTTTKAFVRHGNDNPKPTVKKPKDWAFNKPQIKRSRAKTIKLHAEYWSAQSVKDHLLTCKAGLPECKWLITSNNPSRKLSARDILYVLGFVYDNPRDEIEVEVNDDHRVLNFIDLSTIINTDASEKLATPTLDQ